VGRAFVRGARIAVVGGGPAGSIAAARLAARGASVDLFHREFRGGLGKPCGGGVLPAAFPRSPALALPRGAVIDVLILEAVSPRGRRALVSGSPLFRVFRRTELDAALREEARSAGARVSTRAVTDVSPSPAGFRVSCGDESLDFDRLVAADGVRSLVRARLSRPLPDEDLMRAIGYEVSGFEPAPPHRALVAFERGLRGYLWVFPRPGGASVGACGDAAATPPGELRSRLDRFLARDDARALVPGGERRLVSWFIPALRRESLERPDVGGETLAFVGDAAGTADPVTAEGIRPGIESAEALARAWAEGGSYDAELARSVWPPLRAAAALKDLFYAGPVLEAIAGAAARSETLRELIVDLVRGEAGADGAGARLRRDFFRIVAEVALAPSGRPRPDVDRRPRPDANRRPRPDANHRGGLS